MATSKRKKMFLIIISVYFVIVTIIYFAMGGFYFTQTISKQQGYNKRQSNEFVSVNSNKVYTGTYAGITDFMGYKHYQIQFPGILKGDNRYLNIYYPLDEKEDPSVIESGQRLEGDNAYLILNPSGYYSGGNVIYDKVFGQDTLKNPKEFLDVVKENTDKTPNTLFLTALTIMDNDIQVQLMMWKKDGDSSYHAKKFSDIRYAWASKGTCKINAVQRSSSGNGMKRAFAGLIDIITAPLQGIVIGVYLIMVIVLGGSVK
jgi:hypothetical protein